MPRARCQPLPTLRRGLTFIETVCAVALLGIVAATVFGAFGSIMGQQERQQHRLNAMEVANRLILQYLDDKDTMPQAGLPLAYGDSRYRWDIREIPVRLEQARPEVAEERAANAPLSVDRMQGLAVRVWLSEESGGSAEFNERVPAVALTRLMDPLAMAERNPDSIKLLRNASKQAELLEKLNRIGRTGGGRNPRVPQPPSPPVPSDKGGGSK